MFGGKPNFADKTTDWYKKELYKYAATDPYGLQYETGGYSYYTPTQLSGTITITGRLWIFCVLNIRMLW